MAKKQPPKKSTNTIIVAIISIVVVILVIGLFYISSSGSNKKTSFYARDINDASYDCEDKIDKEYGDDLVSRHFDEFSSRYNADKRQYAIFYRVNINSEINGYPTITEYMAKCVVWERIGYVSEFSIISIN